MARISAPGPCPEHPETAATAECDQCLKPLCPDCQSESSQTALFCSPECRRAFDGMTQSIARWQEQLLDLTKRNRLLYFKPGRSAIRITNHTIDELSEELLSHPAGLSFDYAERGRTKRPIFIDPTTNQVEVPELELEINKGDLDTDCEVLDLQRRLKLLQRKDNEWEQEQGINVLFLALGLLEWIDDDGDRARAPLLLIPANLKRASPRDPFRLLREADDLEFSPTLSHRLSQLGVALPDLDLNEPSDYLEQVRDLISSRQGWVVRDDAYLSTFAYSKLAMWRDLEVLRTKHSQHGLIKQLTGVGATNVSAGPDGAQAAFPPDSELKGGHLDDLLRLKDQFTVVDADYSQLQATEAARTGHNLVIHGPPGTGKSQTITNIAATLMADGKRVLFVSEKRAALDVVKRNLESCELGVLCLDLHSQFGRKAAVYEQLRQAVDAEKVVTPVRKERLQELEDIRDKLNAAVRAVHEPRGELRHSVYRMAGRYAEVQRLPAADLSVPQALSLTHEQYSEIGQACARLSRCGREFRLGADSPWIGLRATDYEVGLADRLRQEGEVVAGMVRAFQAGSGEIAGALGLPRPTTADGAAKLRTICLHLGRSPEVPRHWLHPDALASLRQEADSAKSLFQHCHQFKDRVASSFRGEGFEQIEGKTTLRHLQALRTDVGALKGLLGSDWEKNGVARSGELIVVCQKLKTIHDRLANQCVQLAEMIPGTPLRTWRELAAALVQVESVVALSPVPERWISAPEKVAALCAEFQELGSCLVDRYSELNEAFYESVVEYVDDDLMLRFRADYQGWPRWLRSTYWKDLRLLKSHLKTPRRLSFAEAYKWLDRVQGLQKDQARWDEKSHLGSENFGDRFDGLETDWMALADAIQDCKNLCRNWLGDPEVVDVLLEGKGSGRLLQRAFDSTAALKTDIEETIAASVSRFVDQDSRLQEFGLWVTKAQEQFSTIAEARVALSPNSQLDSLDGVIEAYTVKKDLDDSLAEIASRSPDWSERFGDWFDGVKTEWDRLFQAIDWTLQLGRFVEVDVPQPIVEQAASPATERLGRWAAELSEQFTEKLSVHFDETVTPWGTWRQAKWDELLEWLVVVASNPAQASDHIEYRKACAALARILGDGSLQAVRAVTDDAGLIPDIVDRQVVGAWIDAANREDPALGEFAGTEQRSLRARFRELDRRFPIAARQEVLRKGFERYPHASSLEADRGQSGLLARELGKKRRQMPVRKLLQQVPTLIGRLKPCMLMSPLAVSQFLPLVEGYFDAVVFDEASQVFPEDAVPSIARATQVIVVGDRKQLPPTSFFRRTDEDESLSEDDFDDDADRFIGAESILDAMVGLVGQGQVGEQYLRVHYRSHSEALIQFSNQVFYGERPLVVFPDARLSGSSSPIQSVYLQDGRYEVGKRINHREALKVVDLVCELMGRCGSEQSVGVVALSRSQADYIDEQVELRRGERRDLDRCFSASLDEPFFVKNLENVQGDERDHIILSIGYGPLAEGGAVPNRFGPINREGGQRRLNVAISRARRSMTVVHSLKPSDIVSQETGPRLLRQYLQYASSPEDFFAKQSSEGGEPDSPFEEVVLAALKSRGHDVVPQVGVAGYRIDIGVKSATGSGYVLGIECDGYTYHATPAARDRDWLRESVLEGLGWKLHRVWSTAWIRNPDAELQEIERAIAKATGESGDAGEWERVFTEDGRAGDTDLLGAKPVSAVAEGPDLKVGALFDSFEFADLSLVARDPSLELRATGNLALRPFIVKVIESESPVHIDQIIERVRQRWGLRRAGSAIRERIQTAAKAAVQGGRIEWESHSSRRRVSDRFLVVPGAQLVPRCCMDGDSPRPIDQISETEIAAGVSVVVRAIHGGKRTDVIQQTAREFGFKRTGGLIDERIGQVVDRMVTEGQLRYANEMIVAD